MDDALAGMRRIQRRRRSGYPDSGSSSIGSGFPSDVPPQCLRRHTNSIGQKRPSVLLANDRACNRADVGVVQRVK